MENKSNEPFVDRHNIYRQSSEKFSYFFLGIIGAALTIALNSIEYNVYYEKIYLLIITWFLFIISFGLGLLIQYRKIQQYLYDSNFNTVTKLIWSYKDTHTSEESIKEIESKSEEFKEAGIPILEWLKDDILSEILSYGKHTRQAGIVTNRIFLFQCFSFLAAVLFLIAFKLYNISL